eukprot:Skav215221  [mRNA]  locus=scaffold341:191914:199622:+ [translate_table: standard]
MAFGALLGLESGINYAATGQGRRAELQIGLGLRSQRRYVMRLATVNPEETPAGTWQLQSYLTKQAEYSQLLDLGQVRGFKLTEVFHTFKVRILLYTALEAGDVLQIIAPDGYDFSGLGLLDLPGSTERLTPLLDFSVATLYPRKTLGLQAQSSLEMYRLRSSCATVFYGEQLRGNVVFSAKSVPGQVVMPRLLELSVLVDGVLDETNQRDRSVNVLGPDHSARAFGSRRKV